MLYSRRIAGAGARRIFERTIACFAMNDFERQQVKSLRDHGYALVPDCFSKALTDRIFEKANAMFRNLQIDLGRAYSVQNGQRASLEGLSYDELAATEKMIALRDPLVHIPEML